MKDPTVLSVILCDDPQPLRIGQRLKVTFVQTPNGQTLPAFTLSLLS
jgi:hypothetical protein